MYMEIFTGIAVLTFVILTIFIIRTLIALRRSLIRVNKTLQMADLSLAELELRMKNVDPLLHSLSHLGEICEKKTFLLKQELLREKEYVNPHAESPQNHLATDVAEWVILSASIGKKLFTGR